MMPSASPAAARAWAWLDGRDYVIPEDLQQILPAVDWLLSSAGGPRRRIFLVGSDYVFPRTAHAIIKAEVEKLL